MSQDVSPSWLHRAGLLLLAWELVAIDQVEPSLLPAGVRAGLLLVLLAVSLLALWRWWRVSLPARYAAASLVYLCGWQLLVATAAARSAHGAARAFSGYGAGGLFLIGLVWLVWLVEREGRRYEAARRTAAGHDPAGLASAGSWQPLDPAAWYYGRQRPKVNQSILLLTLYSLVFVLINVASNLSGATDSYELPGGGGGGGSGGGPQTAMAQAVRVQKVVKRKFVINPYSLIKIPGADALDNVKLQLVQSTEHLYTVGQGQGGAGSGAAKALAMATATVRDSPAARATARSASFGWNTRAATGIRISGLGPTRTC